MPGIEAIEERQRPRQSNFGALSAGMIVRGAVPSHVLYGEAVAPTPTPTPAAPPAVVVALPTEGDRPVAGAQRKALTVRLDPVHHMRLRLVGSYLRRSSQDIMIQALNAYLAGLPRSVVEADATAVEPTP